MMMMIMSWSGRVVWTMINPRVFPSFYIIVMIISAPPPPRIRCQSMAGLSPALQLLVPIYTIIWLERGTVRENFLAQENTILCPQPRHKLRLLDQSRVNLVTASFTRV